ncbi:ABC transporter permease [Bacteroidota bacterium]
MRRYIHDIVIAVEAILANKLKSILTGLGIIFGVAAVISMLAIGKGAQQEILESIKLVGVNNIIIEPLIEERIEGEEGKKEKQKYSPGLNLLDVNAIIEVLPSLNKVSPEIELSSVAIRDKKQEATKVFGVSSSYFELFNLEIESGNNFNEYHEKFGTSVCVIGSDIRIKFFPKENPVGKSIKVGHVWLMVIGVLEKRNVVASSIKNLSISNTSDRIYIPAKTMLNRYLNRGIVNTKKGSAESVFSMFGGGGGMHIIQSIMSSSNEEGVTERPNYHQLDKIIVQVSETEELNPSTEILSRLLLRRHNGVLDFEITVPELLLKQQQKTKDIFNIVLGAIASISLIVGGIGIMNIMLASVMERIREIGTRQAIGASRKDIIVQFLAESTLISIVGGIIGIILGMALARLIQEIAEINTIVSNFSVFIAFGVSATVGIVFGYIPAKRAASQDPVESLRH